MCSMISSISQLSIHLLLFIHASYQAPPWIYRNQTDATLRQGSIFGPLYRSVGASLYPHWTGTINDYPRRMILQGMSNGLSSFRAVLIFEQLNGNSDQDSLWSDQIWTPIDALLAAAQDANVHVTIELSGLADWMSTLNPAMEPYSTDNYPLWDALVDFVTSRQNSVNNMYYKDDPTIFAYTVLGEVIPSPSSIIPQMAALLSHVSARLKQEDPRHLVGSGGLLHMSQYSGYYNPLLYWQELYSVSTVDICMIHIYQSPSNVLPLSTGGSYQQSEWTQLSGYSNFCAGIGKPFIIDEFGLEMDEYDRSTVIEYFEYAFDATYSAYPPIQVIQIWNWNPGFSYDFFPNEDMLMIQAVRQNARRWGFVADYASVKSVGTSGFTLPNGQQPSSSNGLIEFESSSDISCVSSASRVTRDNTTASNGEWCMAMPWSFSDTSYATASLSIIPSSSLQWLTDWSMYATGNGRLVCDARIDSNFPTSPTGYQMRLSLVGKSGKMYTQGSQAFTTNFLILYQWNRVFMNLDPDLIRVELASASQITNSIWVDELSAVKYFTLSLVHNPGISAMSGILRVDSCRLEILDKNLMEFQLIETASTSFLVQQQCDMPGNLIVAPDPIRNASSSISNSFSTTSISTSTYSPTSTYSQFIFFDTSKLPNYLTVYQIYLFYSGVALMALAILMLAIILFKLRNRNYKNKK